MKIRYNKILCVIIALFIMVSGMCPEIPQAGSFFTCLDNSSTTSFTEGDANPLSQYQLSGRENLGFRNAAFISGTVKRPVPRMVLRISLLLYLAESLLVRLSNLQRTVETAQAPETHYATALLNYIHRQDGKK